MGKDSALEARKLIYDNIDTIMANAQRLRAEETVSLVELLSAGFMAAHTMLSSIGEMFALAGEAEVNDAGLERIADETWEQVVRDHTDFDTWSDMFIAASQAYVRGRLLDGCE